MIESTVKIYDVGPDEISNYGCESFQWVVAWYETGDYCGGGEAISFDGSQYRSHCLSHCSCFGTDDGMQSGDVISIDAILGVSVTPGQEFKPEVIAKVRQLVAATLSERNGGNDAANS